MLMLLGWSVHAGGPASPGGVRPQQREPQATFRTTTKLVVETVSVKDREGRPIEGLTSKDFTVTEDGQRQEIAFVQFQRLDTTRQPAAPAAPARQTPSVARDSSPVLASTVPAPPVEVKYPDRRLLILYFDFSTMGPFDEFRATSGALKFVDTQMAPADFVAVMAFQGGSVRVKQEFTADRERLRAAIRALAEASGLGGEDVVDDVAATEFGQDDREFRLFNTDRQLAALQRAASMLRTLPERKTLIYFGTRLRLNGTDNQAQLQATVNAAVRANVTINPIDARGLVALAPLGDATQASPGGVGMFSGTLIQTLMAALQRSQDTLYALAKDTGGSVAFDSNDLSEGIVRAVDAIGSYYIIGYYTTNVRDDGRFRRVRVTLSGIPRADLTYREGYFADKAFEKFTAADKERQLEEALMLGDPITEIPIALEVNYFQLNRAQYFVPVTVKLAGSAIALARRSGAARTLIDVIGEVKDDHGATCQNVRDKLDIKLTDATAAALATRPVQYQTGFTLLPGRYAIKVLVRDATTGRIGTYQTSFTIPNLDREERRVAISSVVLSGQRVAPGDALYSVRQKTAVDEVDPLVHEGQKLIPSVTRVFSAGRDLHVFLEAYERDAAARHPLLVFVAFYRDNAKALEIPPVAVSEASGGRPRAVPIRLSIPLGTLRAGRYDCQVSVLDPAAQKVAFWRAPVVVVP